MERLIKSALGQWKLVSDLLRKSPEDPPKPTPFPNTPDMQALRKINSENLTKLFGEQNNHAAQGRDADARATKGKIKDLILRAPKGSVDMGHLGDMKERQLKAAHENPVIHSKWQPFSDDDMEESINHHMGDATSLKDIHNKHGEKGLEALLRNIGAKADAPESVGGYSYLKFKNPGVHMDAIGLMNPGKEDFGRDEPHMRAKGVLPKSPYSKTPSDPGLHKKVDDTWNDIMNNDGWNNEGMIKAHDNAALARAMERFKRHHKIT